MLQTFLHQCSCALDLAEGIINKYYFTDDDTRKDLRKIQGMWSSRRLHISKQILYKHGLPMRKPISGIVAGIYLDHIENQHVTHANNPYYLNIKKWLRYVHDVFCLWECTKDERTGFLEYLTNFHQKLTQWK